MTEKWKDEAWAQDIWYSGKVTRRTRRRLGRRRDRRHDAGAGAVARGLRRRQGLSRSAPSSRSPAPAPPAARPRWSACRWRSTASTRTAASTAVRSKLVIADDEVEARRRAAARPQKMVQEDNIDVHVGGFLSNICLACMPVWEEAKIVNMISVCLDTTLTTSNCNRYSFRVHDYAPAQAVAFAPTLAKMGKKWHIAYADYSWGQSTRDAYAAEIKKNGGEVVGTTGIPLGTADMTPFLSKITGNFDGLFGIFFGKDGVTIGNQAYDLGLTKKYKWAGDGAISESTNLPGARQQDRRLRRHQPLHPGVPGPARHALPAPLLRRGEGAAGEGRSVRPAARPLRAVELRGDERLEDRHGEVEVRGPQRHHEADRGARRPRDEGRRRLPARATRRCARKTIRRSCASSSSRSKAAPITLLETVPKDKTLVPPACKFPAA